MDPNLTLLPRWLTARSICREIPMPVNDRGGFRIDTGSPAEACRWVFPALCGGLSEVRRQVTRPRHFIKLWGTPEALASVLPPRWQILPQSYFMTAAGPFPLRRLPAAYRLRCGRNGPCTSARIIGPDGRIAASGYAAEAMDVFIYDRIETAARHRRRGLGNVIMNALRAFRRDLDTPELLVATKEGCGLYMSLGWRILSPYSTAVIPG